MVGLYARFHFLSQHDGCAPPLHDALIPFPVHEFTLHNLQKHKSPLVVVNILHIHKSMVILHLTCYKTKWYQIIKCNVIQFEKWILVNVE